LDSAATHYCHFCNAVQIGLTMGVDDAIKAARLVTVNKIVGVHYDTFGFIKIDHGKAIGSFKQADMTLHLPAIGSAIEL
jgi:L-ascorbate metabolism protein UlaG (beta-lactamase superfamily)